ncbi:MAG: chemotaxis protein CheW [Bacteroidetes bacterium]|nr:chemotaxis protein CheW [Bacteroidota bacterium]
MEESTVIHQQSFLSFRVGKELFAAEVGKVLHILELMRITAVPHSPPDMLGVINLRGSVLPVMDSRIRFGIETQPFTRYTCIIVMEIILDNEPLRIGVLVDSVQEVIEIDLREIQPPPNIGSKFKAEYIKGMIRHGDEFIMLLDVDKVFTTDELLMVQEVTPEETPDN